MTEREILLKKLSACRFMIDDLKLYLDTHPGDTATIAKINELKEKLKPLKKQYEDRYGPLTRNSAQKNKWKWINSPWPWENEEDN